MSEEKQTNKRINHDTLKWIMISLAGFAIIILIFGAGMVVGGMKAKFSYQWAENYHKNFGGPKGGFFSDWRSMPPMPGEFIEGHGVFGEIIEIRDDGFIIKDRGDIEKVVIITEDTIIKKGMENTEDNLEVGDHVVVIGSPNEEGQVEAKLIRVFNGELKNPPPMPSKGHQPPISLMR